MGGLVIVFDGNFFERGPSLINQSLEVVECFILYTCCLMFLRYTCSCLIFHPLFIAPSFSLFALPSSLLIYFSHLSFSFYLNLSLAFQKFYLFSLSISTCLPIPLYITIYPSLFPLQLSLHICPFISFAPLSLSQSIFFSVPPLSLLISIHLFFSFPSLSFSLSPSLFLLCLLVLGLRCPSLLEPKVAMEMRCQTNGDCRHPHQLCCYTGTRFMCMDAVEDGK